MATAYVIMGVAGSGKTTLGRALATALACPFYDGDEFHPPENVAKMARGVPLTDADRAPWLRRLAGLITRYLAADEDVVIACSALKRAYRDMLRIDAQHVRFVYLRADQDLARRRLQARAGHFMRAEMLESQFAALEEPSAGEALILSAEHAVDDLVRAIRGQASADPA